MRAWVQPFRKTSRLGAASGRVTHPTFSLVLAKRIHACFGLGLDKRTKLGGLGVGDGHALQPDRVIAS